MYECKPKSIHNADIFSHDIYFYDATFSVVVTHKETCELFASMYADEAIVIKLRDMVVQLMVMVGVHLVVQNFLCPTLICLRVSATKLMYICTFAN